MKVAVTLDVNSGAEDGAGPDAVLAAANRGWTIAEIVQQIITERDRQITLQRAGRFAHTAASAQLTPAQRYAIVGEEFGELGGAVLAEERLANDRTGTSQRKELIQLAAVCLAWLEYLHDA